MYNCDLKESEEKFAELEIQVENQEGDFEEDVTEFEESIQEELELLNSFDSNNFDNPDPAINKEIKGFKKLLQKIKTLKAENDFYDAEAELDNMFPNRHDDDFDEDSMSYDSVFGDD
jgi:hypothetical protein